MDQRRLNRDLTVSAQGLGCMDMSGCYGPADQAEAAATIQRALELGVTMFDTADTYGPFTNERLVGRELADHRDSVIVASKFGNVLTPDGNRTGEISGRPVYVRSACDASLKRLGFDTIDLYYQHRVDSDTPIEETWGALADLVTQGKIRFAGICEAAPATIRRAHAVHPVTAVQTEYSLWSRDPESNGVFEAIRELGIGFVPYSPIGRGFLTGEIRQVDDLPEGDVRRGWPRFQAENLQRNVQIVDEVRAIADEKSVTPAQLAIAWVLHQGDDIVPIPGTKRRTHLEENIAASDIKLTTEDLARLDGVLPPGAAAGARYADMSVVDR